MKTIIELGVKLSTDSVNSTIAGPEVWVPQAAVFAQAAYNDGDAGEEEHQAYDNTGHHQRGHQQRSLGPRLPLAAAVWVLPMALVGAHCGGVRGQVQRSSMSGKWQLRTAVCMLAAAPPSGHITQRRPCPDAHPVTCSGVVAVIRLRSQYVNRLIRLLTRQSLPGPPLLSVNHSCCPPATVCRFCLIYVSPRSVPVACHLSLTPTRSLKSTNLHGM